MSERPNDTDSDSFDFDSLLPPEPSSPARPAAPLPVPPGQRIGSCSYLPANQKRPGSGGLGCWLTALTSLIVAAGLIGVALFLPPFSLFDRLFGPAFVRLTAADTAVSRAGITITVSDPAYQDGFSVALASTPLDQFITADGGAGSWIPAAFAAQPPGTALQSAVYSVTVQGAAPAALTLALAIPPTAGHPDLLDMYGYHTERAAWVFLPAQRTADRLLAEVPARELPDRVALFQSAPPTQPRLAATFDVTQRFDPRVGEVATIVAPAGMQPLLDGRLTGTLAPGFALDASYSVLPTIRNFSDARATDPATISAILNNAGVRSHHAAQIAAFAGAGYDGVILDYRDLPADDRAVFAALVREVALNLQGTGLAFGVSLPAPVLQDGMWETGAYDWRAIGRFASFVQVRLPLDPTAYAPGAERPVEALLRWAIGEVSRQKLIAELPALSLRQIGGDFTPIGYGEALSALGNVRLDADRTPAGTIFPGMEFAAVLDGFRTAPGADPVTGLPYLDYLNADGATVARMWLTTPSALRYRLDRLIPFALSGAAFPDLLAPGIVPGALTTLAEFRQSIPAQPHPLELALRWTIAGANNTVIDEVTTGLNDPLVATLAAPDGNYAVNVEVIDQTGAAQVLRGGVAVALFAPTATPTPLPTATPTPTPAPTSTPARIAAAPAGPAAQPSGGSFSAANRGPLAGSIGSAVGAAGCCQTSALCTWSRNSPCHCVMRKKCGRTCACS